VAVALAASAICSQFSHTTSHWLAALIGACSLRRSSSCSAARDALSQGRLVLHCRLRGLDSAGWARRSRCSAPCDVLLGVNGSASLHLHSACLLHDANRDRLPDCAANACGYSRRACTWSDTVGRGRQCFGAENAATRPISMNRTGRSITRSFSSCSRPAGVINRQRG
jgi:hypothetical protein